MKLFTTCSVLCGLSNCATHQTMKKKCISTVNFIRNFKIRDEIAVVHKLLRVLDKKKMSLVLETCTSSFNNTLQAPFHLEKSC